MARTDRLDRDATAARLNRIARLDGFSVKAAKSQSQQDAWRGQFAILSGENVMFTASHPDRIRGWLYTHAA